MQAYRGSAVHQGVVARCVLGAAIGLVALGGPAIARAQNGDAERIRRAAQEAGLGALSTVAIPEPANLDEFLNPGRDAHRAAVRLGKAWFWDMQVGSDGVACASCHFHAGADNRTRNQLNPGSKNRDPAARTRFKNTGSGAPGGPNYRLRESDFPFHRLQDPEARRSAVLFDSDDVVSSHGVRYARFSGIEPGVAADLGTPHADAVFQVAGVNARRVEPRNTPTVINAVFNFTQFWDGRASAWFNGVTGFGSRDDGARILVVDDGQPVARKIVLYPASLASQAVVPPVSDLEMSFAGRRFADIGRKLLGAKVLALQHVHPADSVLGALAEVRVEGNRLAGAPGLRTTYAALIRRAFRPQFWTAGDGRGASSSTLLSEPAYSTMESNFALFFGIALQMYQSTLVSDQTPFDRFMLGDDDALNAQALRGLEIFIDEDGGNCVACHSGPELTSAAVSQMYEGGRPALMEIVAMPARGTAGLVPGAQTAYRDRGFANIGVRPTGEDPGRGGEDDAGRPLSFVRRAAHRVGAAPLPDCGTPERAACPQNGRVATDGAFKVPGLRNVELTGPYFHNGGMVSLEQAVEFYDRRGDFSDANLADLDGDMVRVELKEEDEAPLVRFLLALTDERVRQERAPFDHPQLRVTDGQPPHDGTTCRGISAACDHIIDIPAVGAGGRPAAGLPPLATFLGVAHLDDDEEGDDENDEADATGDDAETGAP